MVTVVTGATGFIGGALVEELVRRGEKVRALVRKTSNNSRLETLGVEIAYGDLQDSASLEAALNGCYCLYHTAALIWAADYRHLKEVNAGGTKSLLEAALKKGVKKVIYTSSGSTLCPERGGTLTEDPPQTRQYLGTYAESKWLADQEAFKLHEKGLPLVSIHPTYVYGPSIVSGLNKAILDFIKGKLL
ncbi:MAG: NAD-dependent epimerase/dehydratase family protein [Chloroflexi bacterium]|nr:NAD-dependent epimerase/dehydratase family protein [Chloroflexota bacterium]